MAFVFEDNGLKRTITSDLNQIETNKQDIINLNSTVYSLGERFNEQNEYVDGVLNTHSSDITNLKDLGRFFPGAISEGGLVTPVMEINGLASSKGLSAALWGGPSAPNLAINLEEGVSLVNAVAVFDYVDGITEGYQCLYMSSNNDEQTIPNPVWNKCRFGSVTMAPYKKLVVVEYTDIIVSTEYATIYPRCYHTGGTNTSGVSCNIKIYPRVVNLSKDTTPYKGL